MPTVNEIRKVLPRGIYLKAIKLGDDGTIIIMLIARRKENIREAKRRVQELATDHKIVFRMEES